MHAFGSVAPALEMLPFSHAFQPIVDVRSRSVFAYEALLRGTDNSSARSVMSGVDRAALQSLDRCSRTSALALAARLGIRSNISLNALPHSLGDDNDRTDALVAEARAGGYGHERIIIEVTEDEVISDLQHFSEIVNDYRRLGFQLAIDDFGAGHSGLNLLADFQPDIIKLDMNLVRDIQRRGPRQSIVRAIMGVCEDLGIEVIAEGIETAEEFSWFEAHGVALYQGFLFARPGFESLPLPMFPVGAANSSF